MTPIPSSGNIVEDGVKDYKRNRKFSVQLGLLGTSEATFIRSHQHDFLVFLYKDNNNRHADMGRGKLTKPQPSTKNRQQGDAESGRNSLPREQHSHWLSSTEWSDLKTHTHK